MVLPALAGLLSPYQEALSGQPSSDPLDDPVMTLQQLLLQLAMGGAPPGASPQSTSSSDYTAGVSNETYPGTRVVNPGYETVTKTVQPSVPRGGGEIPAAATQRTITKQVPTSVPAGDPAYSYTQYARPFTGDVSNLVTRQGLTLQRGPMRSLLDIARASNIMPGAQEVGMIGGGFRPHSVQLGMQSNPYAADPYMSYHEQGIAIDAGEWSRRLALHRALLAAGWNQFNRSYEPWHYSYGVTG